MKKHRPIILGHRGLAGKFPENTALSFRESLAAGADGIECDVQKTADSEFVILHDDEVSRTSNAHGKISELRYADLASVDFGRGERLLTLSDLLGLIPNDKWLNIEIKKQTISLDDCGRLVEIILRLRSLEKTLISSFEHDLLKPFKMHGMKTAMLIGEEHAHLGIKGLIREIFKYRPYSVNLPVQAFERVSPFALSTLVLFFRLLGFRIAFWTVNTDAQFERIKGLADVVITDEVERGLRHRENL